MPDRAYVALGDSFTAGTGCLPGESWADLLAEALGCGDPAAGRAYVNLAFDGATTVDVLAALDRAVLLRPDLVSVVCGANDVLGSTRPDLDGLAARLEAVFSGLARLRPQPLRPDGDLSDRLGLHRPRPADHAPGSAPGSSSSTTRSGASPPNTARTWSRSPATPGSTTPATSPPTACIRRRWVIAEPRGGSRRSCAQPDSQSRRRMRSHGASEWTTRRRRSPERAIADHHGVRPGRVRRP